MAAPGAETTATFRVKALYLCVRSLRGTEGAREFIRRVDAGRIFEDETKPISRELWLRCLKEFDVMVGDQGFARLSRYLVHPKNLGVWSGLLRGAQSPGDIYARLDQGHADLDYGTNWRDVTMSKGRFRGELWFLDSDDQDERRRIRKALSAELRAVPLLFGLAPATVTSQVVGDVPQSASGDDCHPKVVQTARFETAMGPILRYGSLLGVFAGTLAGALSASFGQSGSLRVLLGASVCAVCWLATYLVGREMTYRSQSRAQHLRILALEREGILQKQQVKEISRPHEEPVIAGKYRLSLQLGVGAAGAVWQAKRLTDGVYVAVKLLRSALAQDPRATDRLRREAQALGLSWHPHVVEVLDDGVLPSGVAFLVMELLRGETLARRLQSGPLPAAEVLKWGLQVTDALIAVHSAGIVHRDIKPENLFLHEQEDGTQTLKLVDFGIASVSWAETRLTRHGARVGTRGYAAPEQEEGEQVDARADLYALGITLKEALTGESPSPTDSGRPVTLSEVSSRWGSLFDKLTAPSPASRYGSAREVREELLAMLDAEAPATTNATRSGASASTGATSEATLGAEADMQGDSPKDESEPRSA